MMIEECSELIAALQHWKRKKVTHLHVSAEIADVEIMVGQLRIVFGDGSIDQWKDKKLSRLEMMLRDQGFIT